MSVYTVLRVDCVLKPHFVPVIADLERDWFAVSPVYPPPNAWRRLADKYTTLDFLSQWAFMTQCECIPFGPNIAIAGVPEDWCLFGPLAEHGGLVSKILDHETGRWTFVCTVPDGFAICALFFNLVLSRVASDLLLCDTLQTAAGVNSTIHEEYRLLPGDVIVALPATKERVFNPSPHDYQRNLTIGEDPSPEPETWIVGRQAAKAARATPPPETLVWDSLPRELPLPDPVPWNALPATLQRSTRPAPGTVPGMVTSMTFRLTAESLWDRDTIERFATSLASAILGSFDRIQSFRLSTYESVRDPRLPDVLPQEPFSAGEEGSVEVAAPSYRRPGDPYAGGLDPTGEDYDDRIADGASE